jgi:hypothetical protein
MSQVGEISITESGLFNLTGGELASSNTTIQAAGLATEFWQSGGVHTIQNQLELQNDFSAYHLQAGNLNVANINLGAGAEFAVDGGAVSSDGTFICNGGTLALNNTTTQQFGRLQLDATGYALINGRGPGLDLGNGSTALHFRDSRDVAWNPDAVLIISGWSGQLHGGGADQVFVGTNARGLTSAQLKQVVFKNPAGLPPNNYPARMLATGEIVPRTVAVH